MPQHIATWNPTTQLWETEDVCLFSERQEPLSETWPTSGIAVGGRLYPLPASAHHTAANECSSLQLPTPRAASGRTGRSAAVRRDSMSAPSLEQAIEIANGQLPREFQSWEELPESWQPTALLPTPVAMDAVGARNATSSRQPGSQHHSGTTLTDVLWQMEGISDAPMLPTPRATDGTKGGPNQRDSSGDLMLPSAVMDV